MGFTCNLTLNHFLGRTSKKTPCKSHQKKFKCQNFLRVKKPSRVRLLFHWHVLKCACLSPVCKKYSWYIMLLISVVVNVFAVNIVLSDKLKYLPYPPSSTRDLVSTIISTAGALVSTAGALVVVTV